MNREKIYLTLKSNGVNATMIATSLAVTPQAVHSVIRTGKGSRKIAEAVANICNKSLLEMFPYYKDVETAEERRVKQAELDEKLRRFA